MLDAEILGQIRAAQLEFLPDTVTVVSASLSSDSQGGYTVSGCTTASYMGRLSMVSAREQDVSGRWVERINPTLTLPYDATVSASSLVYVGGICYRIQGVDSAKSWNTALRCPVERWR